MKSTDKGLKRILKAFTYSFDGLKAAFKSEEALRQDMLLCSILLIISLLLKITYIERLILISDSSKFNNNSFYHVMDLSAIDTLITDSNIDKDVCKRLKEEKNIELIIV